MLHIMHNLFRNQYRAIEMSQSGIVKMKNRIQKKQMRGTYLRLLEYAVGMLGENRVRYHARVLRTSSWERRTLKCINGYRIEIRSSREEKHNYAHFHVVKGMDGMASIRIDTLQVLESSLAPKDLKKILDWAKNNRELLVSVWNEFHGYRIIVE